MRNEHTKATRYYVRVSQSYVDPKCGGQFGPVSSLKLAEELLITVASRTDIKAATIEEEK